MVTDPNSNQIKTINRPDFNKLLTFRVLKNAHESSEENTNSAYN